ncbi:SHOCT domain-containing protein [Candidatus Saccharibacteria bacterium]|nr:SHOCT domain-containing protein [Candidatus Saccharibacteria bacterium]
MPGLLRGVARVAVISGTATHVSNNVSRRQQARYDAQNPQPEQYAPAEPAAPAVDPYVELEKLGQLKSDGILTQEEFDAKKKEILGL